MFLDPALVLLWGCAITCIWYGAVRSHTLFSGSSKESAPEEVKFVQSNKVIALPIVGSVVLLLLFFFLDSAITIWIMVVLISLVLLISQFFVLSPLFDYLFDKLLKNVRQGFTIPKIGFIPFSGIALFLYCVGFVLAWLFTGHWILVDVGAWCIGITQMSILRLPSLKISTLLLVPFLIYDVFWVFISPLFFHGESVMVSVATKMPPFPLMLKLPHITNPGAYSGLGLGDIVLPGIFIVYLYNFDEHLKKRDVFDLKNRRNFYLSYFTLSLLEYTLGYTVTILVGSLMEAGQPALLYLVPFTLGGTIFFGWRRGDLALMWSGHHKAGAPKDIEAQSLLGGDEEEGEGLREIAPSFDEEPRTDSSYGPKPPAADLLV